MQNTKLQKIKKTLDKSLLSVLRYQRNKEEIVVFVVTNVDYQILDSLRLEFKNEHFIIFTEDDIVNGKDVFPLEFLHIQNHHLLIEGHDYFTTLKIDKKHLQLKLEFELRNKLVYLREQYLLAPQRKSFLTKIMPTMSIIFEGLIYLKKQENQGFENNLKNIEKNYETNLNIFKEILEAEKNNYNLTDQKINELIQELNDTLVQLSQKIDQIK